VGTSEFKKNQLVVVVVVRASSNCLLTTTSRQLTFPELLPGQTFNPDVQCQLMLGLGAFYCGVSVSSFFVVVFFYQKLLGTLSV